MTPDQENIIRREIDRTRFWLKVDPTNKKRPYLVDWNAALEALYNEKRDLEEKLHECALAEDRIREGHGRLGCDECDPHSYPCDVIKALEGR